MKDFLYLDTDTISSISAQLFEGNVSEVNLSESSSNGESTSDTRTNKNSEGSGLSASLKVVAAKSSESVDFIDSITNKWDDVSTIAETQKKVFDDYLYNITLQKLNEESQIKDPDEANQFDFVNIDGAYKVIDVHTASRIFDTDLLKKIPFMNESTFEYTDIKVLDARFNKINKFINNPGNNKLPNEFNTPEEALEFYQTYLATNALTSINEITTHLDKVFGDKIIMARENVILIGNRDLLRLQPELLSLVETINIEGFGRKITETDPDRTIKSVSHFEGVSFEEKNEFISKGTQGILMLFLSIILGLNENDTFDIIQPIGLEFSKVSR